ncbi:MAG: metallophosphoesterase family protein [Christensenellales bacterium]
MPSRLCFRDGQFKIMQVADVQEQAEISADTLRLLEAALDADPPDLVIFTGDQVMGYSGTFKKGDVRQRFAHFVQTLTAPLEEREIPFTVTFGNHDLELGLPLEEQEAIYRESPLYVRLYHSPGPGTGVLPVYDGACDRHIFALYLFESGGRKKGGGYESVRPEYVGWYRRMRDQLASENGREPLAAMVFQHIPLREYYHVLMKVRRGTRGAVRAFGIHKNEFYILPGPTRHQNELFREAPSVPDENTGSFQAFAERGDVCAVFCGHDHNNSFVRDLGDIDLGYTQTCGFDTYGPDTLRGVRIVKIHERNLRLYDTYTLTYRELVAKRPSRPLMNAVYNRMPTSIPQAVHLLKRIGFAVLGLMLLGLLLIWIL